MGKDKYIKRNPHTNWSKTAETKGKKNFFCNVVKKKKKDRLFSLTEDL